MKKYKDFLETKSDIISIVMVVLFAIAMFFAINIEMKKPVDAKELEHQYSQLEMIKQDVSNIYQLENAEICIDDQGIDITLKGKYHNLNASFDENNNYINATVADSRIGSNITDSIFAIILAGVLGYIASFVVLVLLYIPVIIHGIFAWITKKRHLKKNK